MTRAKSLQLLRLYYALEYFKEDILIKISSLVKKKCLLCKKFSIITH